MEINELKLIKSSEEMASWLVKNSDVILPPDEFPGCYRFGQYRNSGIGKAIGYHNEDKLKPIVIDGNLAITFTDKAADISKEDFLEALTGIWEEDEEQSEDFEIWVSCSVGCYQMIKAACIVIVKNKE